MKILNMVLAVPLFTLGWSASANESNPSDPNTIQHIICTPNQDPVGTRVEVRRSGDRQFVVVFTQAGQSRTFHSSVYRTEHFWIFYVSGKNPQKDLLLRTHFGNSTDAVVFPLGGNSYTCLMNP